MILFTNFCRKLTDFFSLTPPSSESDELEFEPYESEEEFPPSFADLSESEELESEEVEEEFLPPLFTEHDLSLTGSPVI